MGQHVKIEPFHLINQFKPRQGHKHQVIAFKGEFKFGRIIENHIPEEVEDEPGVVGGGRGLDEGNAGVFEVAVVEVAVAVAEEEVEEGGVGGRGVAKGGVFGGEEMEEGEGGVGGGVEREEAREM